MNKQALIKQAYDRSALLQLDHPDYLVEVEKATLEKLKHDVGTAGDITSLSTIANPHEKRAAVISAKENGIIAGLSEIVWFYESVGMQVFTHKKDGEAIEVGHNIITIEGSILQLLETERTGLNLLQRMSGIASKTARIQNRINEFKTRIAGSRKTVLYLDNKAIAVGGGLTHRLALWDAIMIKDNHLKELELEGSNDPIKEAIDRAWRWKDKANFIEVEVIDAEGALHAANIFSEKLKDESSIPCIIMLDNIKPPEIKKIIASLKEAKLSEMVILEASGNITEENALDYAATGVDVISMGAITHSAIALDLSQKILR